MLVNLRVIKLYETNNQSKVNTSRFEFCRNKCLKAQYFINQGYGCSHFVKKTIMIIYSKMHSKSRNYYRHQCSGLRKTPQQCNLLIKIIANLIIN